MANLGQQTDYHFFNNYSNSAGSLSSSDYWSDWGYCTKHGYFKLTFDNKCFECARSEIGIPLNNQGDEKMAKRVLATEQKAAIVYGRARGFTDENLVSLYADGKLTPSNIDDIKAFAKLIAEYDPAEEEDEKND